MISCAVLFLVIANKTGLPGNFFPAPLPNLLPKTHRAPAPCVYRRNQPMIKPFFAVCVALCGAVTTLHAQTMPTEPIDGIAAVVNDDIVLKSELDAAVQGIVAQYRDNPQQLPPRDVLEKQVLERLIMTKLQVARADSSGVKVSDADVDQTVAQIAAQNKLDVAGLRRAVESQGQTFEQFRRSVHDEVVVQRLQQGVIQSRAQVSDAEIDSFLKNDKRALGELDMQHILIALPDGADAVQIEKARSKAEDVKHQIDQGLDFSAAAIRYSDAQNALDGGKLGWRSADKLPQEFAERATSMQKGEVSVPMRGPAGFHIIKLVDRRALGTELVTEYHSRHILIKISELVSSDQAKAQVVALRKRALAGEDFGKLAKEYSEDPATANLSGDMGWFQKEGYGTRVAQEVSTLKIDEIGEPFQTELGWHVLQLLGERQADRSAEVQRTQARQALIARKADDEYQSYLRQLRSEAYIEIRLPGAAAS